MHSSLLLRVSDPISEVSAFGHVRILLLACYSHLPDVCAIPSAAEGAEVCSVNADVQKRATRVLNSGSDAIIQSTTGSGKTLSFLMPLLGSAIKYPPEANPAEFPVRIFSETSQKHLHLHLLTAHCARASDAMSLFRTTSWRIKKTGVNLLTAPDQVMSCCRQLHICQILSM